MKKTAYDKCRYAGNLIPMGGGHVPSTNQQRRTSDVATPTQTHSLLTGTYTVIA